MIVSAETGDRRTRLVEQIDAKVAPLAMSGRVERVIADDPAEVKVKLESPTATTIVDLEAKNLSDEQMRPLVANMHLRQVSNALKHLAALRAVSALAAVEGTDVPRFSLVLEDDALFGDQMTDVIAGVAAGAPSDADVVFLGLPSTRQAPPRGSPPVFDDPLQLFKDHVVPACESYMVTPAGAAKIVAGFLPIRFCANAQLTYLLRSGAAKAYVSVPNAFVDGSKVGVVTSSLNPNNQLAWNQAYAQLDALIRRTPGSYAETQRAQFDAFWSQNAFKEHPDSLVLLGDHHRKLGEVAASEAAYDRALAAYDRDGCIVNNNSDFLRRWMSLFSFQDGA